MSLNGVEKIKIFINNILDERDNNKIFESLYKLSNEERKVSVKILLELKKEFKNEQLNLVKNILKIIECVGSENNIISKYKLKEDFKLDLFEVTKLLAEAKEQKKSIISDIIPQLTYKQANIAGILLKKKKILEEEHLEWEEQKNIERYISALGVYCRSIKDEIEKEIKTNIEEINEKNDVFLKEIVINLSEAKEFKEYYIKKNSLIIVDYDNISPTKRDIEKISEFTTIILVCHKKEQENLINSFKIGGMVKIINVNCDLKQSSDMKIYSILSKAQILNIENKFVVSRDKGFDAYCKVNKIECKILPSLKGVYMEEEKIYNFSEIDSHNFNMLKLSKLKTEILSYGD